MARAQGILRIASCTCCSAHKSISPYQSLKAKEKAKCFKKGAKPLCGFCSEHSTHDDFDY